MKSQTQFLFFMKKYYLISILHRFCRVFLCPFMRVKGVNFYAMLDLAEEERVICSNN